MAGDKVTYDLDGHILKVGGAAVLDFDQLRSEHPEAANYLAMVGAKSVVYRNQSTRSSRSPIGEGSSLAEREAFAIGVLKEIQEKGIESAKRKPGRLPGGVLRADRIAALASSRGYTISAISQALKQLPADRQRVILYSDEVEDKLRELKQAGEAWSPISDTVQSQLYETVGITTEPSHAPV